MCPHPPLLELLFELATGEGAGELAAGRSHGSAPSVGSGRGASAVYGSFECAGERRATVGCRPITRLVGGVRTARLAAAVGVATVRPVK